MTTYPIDDYEEESRDWSDDDDYSDDPNRCPECGKVILLDGDMLYCQDAFECGWSEYLGDE